MFPLKAWFWKRRGCSFTSETGMESNFRVSWKWLQTDLHLGEFAPWRVLKVCALDNQSFSNLLHPHLSNHLKPGVTDSHSRTYGSLKKKKNPPRNCVRISNCPNADSQPESYPFYLATAVPSRGVALSHAFCSGLLASDLKIYSSTIWLSKVAMQRDRSGIGVNKTKQTKNKGKTNKKN